MEEKEEEEKRGKCHCCLPLSPQFSLCCKVFFATAAFCGLFLRNAHLIRGDGLGGLAAAASAENQSHAAAGGGGGGLGK